MSDQPPKKPAFGAPCNGCGLCCATEVCAIGRMAHGDVQAPCPSLIWHAGRSWCALVAIEPAAGKGRPIAEALGIGRGCDADA